jgi:hypothetical protein
MSSSWFQPLLEHKQHFGAVALLATAVTTVSIFSFQRIERRKYLKGVKKRFEEDALTSDELPAVAVTEQHSTSEKKEIGPEEEHLIKEQLSRNYAFLGLSWQIVFCHHSTYILSIKETRICKRLDVHLSLWLVLAVLVSFLNISLCFVFFLHCVA